MNAHFTNVLISGSRDYSEDLAAMKRTAERARKDPTYRRQLLIATGMYTKSGKLKKQFR
ncbi:MAG: hypothetical protein NTV80_22740 [Verrucomicrobia bacterium]|nr:hypothetical protein [Verrucomicrobiota bacterium]